ncbi:LacI family transcriptional regulator, partial [Kitasatospora sp. NPDC059817]
PGGPAPLALPAPPPGSRPRRPPRLPPVAPPTRAVGETAVGLLLRRLTAGPDLPVHRISLLPALRIRTSCGG